MSSVEAPAAESFRTGIRDWLRADLAGEFAAPRGELGREHEEFAARPPGNAVPCGRPGVGIRPLIRLTGAAGFNEVVLGGARAPHVVGAPGDGRQRLVRFLRADTRYAGSDEIQRNTIAERVLGLPREAKP
ncbi:acyl-CoA dehydrogenase family protein [Streptomyces sp. NPDC056149]|uniref:acyl-CoA dehydrogenase family protein n=1 Tax=unclassified Streptomyces TaxID=2593676 RepID=UPI0023818729|nr:acyl-CoA dehydrogenase family protein [Streptomyces sp. WZ-12]